MPSRRSHKITAVVVVVVDAAATLGGMSGTWAWSENDAVDWRRELAGWRHGYETHSSIGGGEERERLRHGLF